MYNEDYDKEILWRKEFSILTGVIFILGFIICAVIGFFAWEEYLYQYLYQPNLFEFSTPFGLAMPTGLIGGYIFFSLLSGLLFTIHFIGKRSTVTKVVMTVLFIIPILLIILGIIYSIPYAIYNIIKFIILKSKRKNAPIKYRVKPEYPSRYANIAGAPTPQPPHMPYINNIPTPPIHNENPLINNNTTNQPPHTNTNANTNGTDEKNYVEETNKPAEKEDLDASEFFKADYNSAQKHLFKLIDDYLNELEESDDLLIYEKPYDKLGVKRTTKKENFSEDNINNEDVEENSIEKENKEPDTSTSKSQEKAQNPMSAQAPVESPISTPNKPSIQNSTPFKISSRLPKDPENPYGDDFSSMV